MEHVPDGSVNVRSAHLEAGSAKHPQRTFMNYMFLQYNFVQDRSRVFSALRWTPIPAPSRARQTVNSCARVRDNSSWENQGIVQLFWILLFAPIRNLVVSQCSSRVLEFTFLFEMWSSKPMLRCGTFDSGLTYSGPNSQFSCIWRFL